MAGHTETDFEVAIEHGLTSRGGYARRSPDDFDEDLCLFPADVLSFLKDTQPQKWDQLEALLKGQTADQVLSDLTKELATKGSLHVLRHGFRCYGKTLRMAYFQPNTSMNPETTTLYAKNRLTITRQVAFTSVKKAPGGKGKRCILDVTLAVNGLPVATAELKNNLGFTPQRAADAKTQYMRDRDERDLMFKFRERSLVHFAVDPDEVWMTTRLKGGETFFLPFNKGHNRGAGNPPVEGNWKTAYLWDEVLARDSLLDILQRFMHLEVKEKKIATERGPKTIRKETMIFPRYHQLDAVRKLVAHAKARGAGRNYLVQHSAGSGKSNSIAWLAHRLAGLHDAADAKIFHSVIVVTDRLVLDQQLQNTIYQFEHKTGVVEKIDENTQQLARAISNGVPIIITTIQKFPFIAQALRTLEEKGEELSMTTADKRYAVIVDEAHSSQTGETASALRGMLNKDGIEAAVAAQLSDVEDENLTEDAKRAILRDTLRRGRQPNLSFFAFTATPKFKTKAMFDEPGPDGQSPFHEYTMKQAIEESFIMDVLKNYTTYKRFYGLVKQIENDPQVPKRAAAKILTRFLTLHPHNIEQVVTIIVEHFRANVMHEIGGRAKAMVVTGSRLEAVRYKLAFDRYIAERGYKGIKSLVAFSGAVEDPAIPERAYTEVAMNNGLPEAELPETFDSDEFRVLLVADKYQTGFDQPLLQAMYVVKRLAGVQAVQTLSRLNRMAPGKARTFVLDFANEEDDIFKAFKPYYEDTPVGENVDPQRLNELQHRVLEWAIFAPEDVSSFSVVWYGKKKDHTASDHRTMNAILDRAVDAFQRREEEEREEFRGQITAFRNLYAFLSQIIPYQDSELEQFYTFCRNLISKLPPPGDGSSFTLDDEVALKYFRIQQITQGSISLDDGETDPLKGPTDVGSGGRKDEEVGLKDLVERLNERFGTSFNRADQLFFEQVRESAEGDDRIVKAALANKYDNFASYLERMLDELFIDRMDGNEEVFSKVMSDQPFRAAVHKGLARELYERIRETRRH